MVDRMITCSRRRGWILILVAGALLSVIVKAPQLLAPMGQDQGLYNAAAERILAGGVPYRDVWDPKPPAIFYTHAALLALIHNPWQTCDLGHVPDLGAPDLQPRCGALAFGLVDLVYALGLGGVVYALARRLGMHPVASAIAFGLTATCANLALLDPEGNTPEKDALLPAVLVLLVGLSALRSRRRSLWLVVAGACAGLAVLVKQPDVTSCAALTIWLGLERRWRDLPALWGGVLLVVIAAWGALALMGAGGAFIDATVGYNVGRFGYGSGAIPLRGVVTFWQMFRDALAPLVLPGLLGAVVAWRGRTRRLIVIWAVCDVLALGLGGTKFTRTYFMQIVPSFAVLAAMGLEWLWCVGVTSRLGRAWIVASLATITIMANAFQAGFTIRVWNEYVSAGSTTTSVERLAAMIGALPPSETLLVWGDQAELYLLSDHPPSTRFLNTTGLVATGDRGASARRAEFVARTLSNPPSVVVLDKRTSTDDPDGRLGLAIGAFPELQSLLQRDYRQMDESVLAGYLGGDRDLVYIRQGGPDLCAAMPGCRLVAGPQ